MAWSYEDHRTFARKYIKRRLDEGRNDAIEELSAYLADWMYTKERFKKIFDDERSAVPT